jgi:septal ring-binding cell division protein DamX
MWTKKQWLSWASSMLLGALPLGARAIAASVAADDPTSAAAAEATAADYRAEAEQYRQLGGTGYKAGLVQRAEADERAQIQKDQEVPAPPTSELPCGVSKPAADVGTSCTGPE